MLKSNKLSMLSMAIAITKKQSEKSKDYKKTFSKNKVYKPKSKGLKLVRQSDGSFISFIPENMKHKGMLNTLKKNSVIISDFKENESALILKI